MACLDQVMTPAWDGAVISLDAAIAPGLVHPKACRQTRARGSANRRWRVGTREARAGRRQPVDVWGLRNRVAIAAGVAAAVLVGDENDQILGFHDSYLRSVLKQHARHSRRCGWASDPIEPSRSQCRTSGNIIGRDSIPSRHCCSRDIRLQQCLSPVCSYENHQRSENFCPSRSRSPRMSPCCNLLDDAKT